MDLTADMILTDFGRTLPLDRGRKDALANYARRAAHAADARSAQRWCEREWGLKDYEAKDLLKGNASEAVWERIVKHRNGGWRVVLPIMGAVIGQGFEEFLADEHKRLARERERYEEQERRLGEMAAEMRALFRMGHRRAGEHGVRPDWSSGERAGELGDRQAEDALEPRSLNERGRS